MNRKNNLALALFWIFLLVLIFSSVVHAQIYLGVTDGYVKNITNDFVPGVEVNVTVSGCSSYCTGSDTTDSNGYYVIGNLNMNENGSASAEGTKGNFYGNNTGITNQFQVARINITIYRAPSSPTLVAINDTHNNTFFWFNWTSGIDPDGLSTYDDWILDSTIYSNVTSPQNKSYLSFIVHTWKVRTCNANGCSAFSTDSFNVYNNVPPAPNLEPISDSNNNNVIFNWTSGGADPEGDSTYFDFYLDGNITSSATSPISMSVSNGSHTWKVRECDAWDCSNWATDTFTITNNPPSSPTLVPMNHTVATSKQFYWTSGIDPDADTTYDEFKFHNEAIVSPATSGVVQALSGIIEYTWRVRTCDSFGACSNWAEDSFIRYFCEEAVVPPSVPGGGGGAGRAYAQPYDVDEKCFENWICEKWSLCSPEGQQYRTCKDINDCFTERHKPIESRACVPSHCFNGKKDFSERAIDCGGRCRICLVPDFEIPAFVGWKYAFALSIKVLIWIIILILVLMISIYTIARLSDIFRLYVKLRIVDFMLDIKMHSSAYIYFTNKVLPLYKLLQYDLKHTWLGKKAMKLYKSSRRRLNLHVSKIKIKKRMRIGKT